MLPFSTVDKGSSYPVYSPFAEDSGSAASGQNEEVKGQDDQPSPTPDQPNTQNLFGGDSSYVYLILLSM